jgi:hypothetical protein
LAPDEVALFPNSILGADPFPVFFSSSWRPSLVVPAFPFIHSQRPAKTTGSKYTSQIARRADSEVNSVLMSRANCPTRPRSSPLRQPGQQPHSAYLVRSTAPSRITSPLLDSFLGAKIGTLPLQARFAPDQVALFLNSMLGACPIPVFFSLS